MKVHVKVFIKSEADLPDRTDNYIVGLKDEDGSARLLHFAPTGLSSTIIKLEWLRNVDYWLKEVDLSELIEVPDDEEALNEFENYYESFEKIAVNRFPEDEIRDNKLLELNAWMKCATWMREQILKRNR
jgi:hypothetical protein